MNPRSNTSLIERFLDWWSGMFSQPGGGRRSASADSGREQRDAGGTSDREEQSGVLGDLPDSESYGDDVRGRSSDPQVARAGADAGAGRDAEASSADRAVGLADGGRFDDRASTDRDDVTPSTGASNADVDRQDESVGASGASADEFGTGGYQPAHPDQDDVEEAAEAGTGDRADTENRVEEIGLEDLDDASGDDESGVGDVLPDSEGFDEPDHMHNAVGGHRTDDDPSELDEGPVDRSGVVDESMEGDTDYVVSGYPSESLDIDIKDTDDIGVYDADSVDDTDENEDADFSEDVGELGLADSETVDDGVPDTQRVSGFRSSPDDIGVGGPSEVDDDSMITADDAATSFQDVDMDDDVGEGIQSYASTADRDALAEIQETASTEPGELSPNEELGGLGSDESPADDPTSVGVTEPSRSGQPSGPTDSETPVSGPAVSSDRSRSGAGSAAPGSDTGGQTYAGAVRGDGSESCPADYPIKGNAGSKIYHVPGRASYDATRPEWCFATEEDAVNAGFRAPKR